VLIPSFRKHMDKHYRPYKCSVTGCKIKDFSNAGELKRHKQEVHSPPAFSCPVVSCKRHRRGFSRRDNLKQHLERCHEDSNDTASASKSMIGCVPDDSAGGWKDIGEGSTTSSEGGDSAVGEKEVGSLVCADQTSLAAKLLELESEKAMSMARFDADIAALKRVLSFM
jgi:hypothetical protein